MSTTTCFDVFRACAEAVDAGALIESLSARDKEFHFQNWFQARLGSLDDLDGRAGRAGQTSTRERNQRLQGQRSVAWSGPGCALTASTKLGPRGV